MLNLQVGVMAVVGKAFGLSLLQATRAGLLLAAGGEFAFVTFGEAVTHKILPAALVSKLFLIVALSMALTPFLAEFGAQLAKMFESSDVKALQPNEGQVTTPGLAHITCDSKIYGELSLVVAITSFLVKLLAKMLKQQ